MTKNSNLVLGFIGQGWIGKNLADHYVDRGFTVVRYGLESKFAGNRSAIATCDVVFIAVPTPTTPNGFNSNIIESVLPLVGDRKIAVIKSTVAPGTTDWLAKMFPTRYVLHVPEFLREAHVRYDVDHPARNIIGIPTIWIDNPDWNIRAGIVEKILPNSPVKITCKAIEAELVKYGSNAFLYLRVVLMNLLYDLTDDLGASWDIVAKGMSADPRIGSSHMSPVHQSDPNNQTSGRGAGGHCLLKDFRSLLNLYRTQRPADKFGIALLEALEAKNLELLNASGKDSEIVREVYGK